MQNDYINQAIMNAFNNPFLINSLTQSIIHNINNADIIYLNIFLLGIFCSVSLS